MKLVIIVGPHAVGKMTVGQELAKRTGLKLFFNHMTIDMVTNLFSCEQDRWRLICQLREDVFNAFAKTDEYGMIFTYMWAFEQQSEWDYMAHVEEIFTRVGAPVYYVELEADYNLRLARNRTENRLLHKPTKRDLVHSEEVFKRLESKYRLNSLPGEVQKEHYLRIDNTNLSPQEAAQRIQSYFDL